MQPRWRVSSNPYGEMQRQVLHGLSTDDLLALINVTESGKREGEWTERESAAAKALSCAFEQEVQRAGYRSVAEFQRHPFRVPRASHQLSRQSAQVTRVVA